MAVSERAAELGVCGVQGECMGYCVDYGAGDGVPICVHLGASDEKREDAERWWR